MNNVPKEELVPEAPLTGGEYERGMQFQARWDKERLDWFDMHGVEVATVANLNGSVRVIWHRGYAYGETIREAIDNAMLQLQILNDPDDEPQADSAQPAAQRYTNELRPDETYGEMVRQVCGRERVEVKVAQLLDDAEYDKLIINALRDRNEEIANKRDDLEVERLNLQACVKAADSIRNAYMSEDPQFLWYAYDKTRTKVSIERQT